MQRQVFVVDAAVVDANGVYNHLSGYPKPVTRAELATVLRRLEGG